jgi:hypothetical protein
LSDLPEGPHGAAGNPLLNYEVLVEIAELLEILFVLESELDGLDLFVGTVGQVGDGAVGHLPVLAIRLAEQVTGVLLAVDGVGTGVDEHSVHILSHYKHKSMVIIEIVVTKLVATFPAQKNRNPLGLNGLRKTAIGRSVEEWTVPTVPLIIPRSINVGAITCTP